MNKTKLAGSAFARDQSRETEKMIGEILTSKFFMVSCDFSKKQRMSYEDRKVLLQSMMLLDANTVQDFEPPDFSEKFILKYLENIRESYSDKQSNILKSAIQYLTDAFPGKNKQLEKNFIPFLVYVADIAEDREIKPTSFRRWFTYFVQEDQRMDNYKMFCSANATKPESIEGRLAVMTKSFCVYHGIEIPEELRGIVANVEEKLVAKN